MIVSFRHTLLRAIAAASVVSSASALAAVPNPVVVGPVAQDGIGSPSRNYPMLAADSEALAAAGYVEEEFLVSGSANCYSLPRLKTGAIISTTPQPYKTRMIVRRPADPVKSNGVVFVEWLNASNGLDIDSTWAATSKEAFLRAGATWVGVTVQNINVQYLKNWSASRYGTLNVEPAAGNGCPVSVDAPVSPDMVYSTNTGFDIMSQVAQAIRRPGAGVDPLRGTPRRVIVATGASQSATRLVPYINSVHPLNPVFDGFFLAIPVFDSVIRTDMKQKVFKVQSEWDVAQSTPETLAQNDGDSLRIWQVTAAPHTTYQNVLTRLPVIARDSLTPVTYPSSCVIPQGGTVVSRIPSKYVMAAAADHLVEWIGMGMPPPVAPRIATVSGSSTIERDAYGTALGGIRLPHLEVPIATNSAFGCSTFGTTVPFTRAQMLQRYRSQENYVNAVRKAAEQNLRSGYIMKTDAEAIVDEAAALNIGRW